MAAAAARRSFWALLLCGIAAEGQFAGPRYLVLFRTKFGICRIEELRSAVCAVVGANVPIAELDPIPVYGDPDRLVSTCDDIGPPVFQWITFPSINVARLAARRCACVRAVIEVWAHGGTEDSCAAHAASLSDAARTALLAPMGDGGSWAVHFHSYGLGQKGGSGLTLAQRNKRLGRFKGFLELLPGPVDLSDARAHSLWLVEDWDPPRNSERGDFKALGPSFVALGRLLALGAADEVFASRLGARQRLHITSLPADLSVLLANFARVRPGSVVVDPFCGTGSILIGAALVARIHQHGGGECTPSEVASACAVRCFGVDIADCAEDVASNFGQLGLSDCLQRVLCEDVANVLGERQLPGRIDAIVTDPPYEIMVPGRGSIAQPAAGSELAALAPLLALAAAVLSPDGCLVFLLPAPAHVESVELLLPACAELRVEDAWRMHFTAKSARWLVRMRRTARDGAMPENR